ncbi:MAG TPA: preprotein translocase subunit YajC [Longimicrobiaceae bacterium]|nr:preprotein translocase subunit YajC [Longimicrobiaceae bacterium]
MATILLQSASASALPLIIEFGAVLAIMYFLFIMPQRREQKKHRAMLEALQPGNSVVTAGGLMGEIVNIKEMAVTLKTGDARVVVDRGRIARVVPPPAK